MKNKSPYSSEEGVYSLCWRGMEERFGIKKEVWGEPAGVSHGSAQVGGGAWGVLELGMYMVCVSKARRVLVRE